MSLELFMINKVANGSGFDGSHGSHVILSPPLAYVGSTTCSMVMRVNSSTVLVGNDQVYKLIPVAFGQSVLVSFELTSWHSDKIPRVMKDFHAQLPDGHV